MRWARWNFSSGCCRATGNNNSYNNWLGLTKSLNCYYSSSRVVKDTTTEHLHGGRLRTKLPELTGIKNWNFQNTRRRASMGDPTCFRMALVQMSVGLCKKQNLQTASRLIEQAAKAGASIVALPECFNSPYGIQYFPEYAEKIPHGESSLLMGFTAKQFNIYIIAGSIPEIGSDNKLYNTCVVYDPNGDMIGKHRKVHLFDIEVPGKIAFQESKVLAPGNSLTVVNTRFCKIGLGICYDMRFPEMAQIYRQSGCEILVYPGAFNMTTGPAHWELLQRSRALDNQIYVATISPARDDTATYTAWGHSMFVDPWGKIMSKAEETETVIYADIDLVHSQEVRKHIPVSRQKRDDLYEVNARVTPRHFSG